GRREVERGGRTEAARAEEQHSRFEELLLAGFADLGEEYVAAVAIALLGIEHRGGDPGAAFVLPAAEPAGHGNDVGIPEVLQRLRRERGTVAGRAIDDDRRVLTGELVLGLR